MVDAQRTPLGFDREHDLVRQREGVNLLMHVYRSNSLFSFWLFSFLSFPHTRFFLFPSISFRIPIPQLWFSLLFCFLFTARFSFYSACRDRILLFQPLTSFVWSGYTSRPPLVRLCATPPLSDKEGYFVYLIAVAPFPATVQVLSLSISLMACTQWFQLNLLLLGSMSSQQDTSPKRA